MGLNEYKYEWWTEISPIFIIFILKSSNRPFWDIIKLYGLISVI